MGYNGNNRKLRTSVIKKSSFKYGDRLVSNLLAIPISLTRSLLLDLATPAAKTQIHHNDKDNTLQYESCIIPIRLLSNAKYNHIRDQYNAMIANNSIIRDDLNILQKQIKRTNNAISALSFLPFLKKKFKSTFKHP